ncbi:MAG: copper-binding protein [Acidimicrobiales bacterium]|nr:copper-binding protein [Acidimicrobiales bacterium]
MTTTSSWAVAGMTCDHCARAVRTEVERVSGVERAVADVAAGRLDVTAVAPPAEDALRDAIDEAGYTLVGPWREP